MSDTLPPTVAPDIDPVLLMRVHPAAESMSEAEAAAIAQGEETAAGGRRPASLAAGAWQAAREARAAADL